jgi:S1-C subfamily serine protease
LRILLTISLVLLAGTARAGPALEAALAAEAERIRVIERCLPAVGAVFRKDGGGGGSGVLISPEGYALTNQHVTGNASEMRVGLPDGRLYRATVIGVDPMGDIALLRLHGERPFPFVALGDSDSLRVGDWAIAMGNPFLLATDFRPTVTLGIVGGVHRFQPGRGANRLVYPDCIQVDTPINPGNSGGPLFDGRGRLVGINGRISVGPRGRNNVGVGFAVSINQIRNFLPDLRAGRWVDHGTLDATVRDEETEGGRRTIFDRMYEDSVAAKAGIRLGDELVTFDGRPVRGANDFLNRITVLPEGWQVEVGIRRVRDGKAIEKTLRIRLAGIPTATETDRKKHEIDPEHVTWETARLLRRNLARWGPAKADGYRGAGVEVKRTGPALVRTRGEVVESVGPDGAWRRRGDAREALPELRAGRLGRDAALLAALASGDPASLGEARLVGGDRIEGRVVDVVRAKLLGEEVVLSFDAETGDLLRVSETTEATGGTVTILLSDHRPVEGGVRPHRWTVRLHGRIVQDDRIETWSIEEAKR